MSHLRRLRAIGVGVLALMALGSAAATAAHAETEFRVNGEPLETEEALNGTFEGSWLFPIGKKVLIHCSTRLWVGMYKLPKGEIDDIYKYENCVTLISEAEAPSCAIEDFSLETRDSFFLHNGVTYMLQGPVEGTEKLGAIKFSKGCSLGSELSVVGSYVMECVGASCETEAVTHKFKTAASTLFSDTLKIGGESAKMEGAETIELGGVNKGQKWSVVA